MIALGDLVLAPMAQDARVGQSHRVRYHIADALVVRNDQTRVKKWCKSQRGSQLRSMIGAPVFCRLFEELEDAATSLHGEKLNPIAKSQYAMPPRKDSLGPHLNPERMI
jgi:hypothetical protein